jgi:hypothetical protein
LTTSGGLKIRGKKLMKALSGPHCKYKEKSMAFKKGQSGNPKGKPKGALNKTTMAAQKLLDGEAQEITRKAVELAKEGNPIALRLCLERVLPPRKDRPITLKLPKVEGAADVIKALSVILETLSKGEITPAEAGALTAMVEVVRKGIETVEIEVRLRALEEKANHGK